MIDIDCSACPDKACEQPAQAAVWIDDEDEYWTCPMGFIPDEVTAWAADYGYTKEMGGALPYRQLPARWAVARGYYLTRLAKYKQISAGGGQARQQAEQATAAGLKAMFDAKRQEQDGNV